MSSVREQNRPAVSPSPVQDWWQYLQQARAELEAAGAKFSTGPQIDDYIEQLRGEVENPSTRMGG